MGTDGVKVAMVTQRKKDKRRKNRTPKYSGGKRRQMHKGSDNVYKEFKIAIMYDASNEHKHVFATNGNHEVLGRLLRRQAAKLNLTQLDEKAGLADGAGWITKQFQSRLPMLDVRILDFYLSVNTYGRLQTSVLDREWIRRGNLRAIFYI